VKNVWVEAPPSHHSSFISYQESLLRISFSNQCWSDSITITQSYYIIYIIIKTKFHHLLSSYLPPLQWSLGHISRSSSSIAPIHLNGSGWNDRCWKHDTVTNTRTKIIPQVQDIHKHIVDGTYWQIICIYNYIYIYVCVCVI
jgi:hypothetical protein